MDLQSIIFGTFGETGDNLIQFNGFGFPENIDEFDAKVKRVDDIGLNNQQLYLRKNVKRHREQKLEVKTDIQKEIRLELVVLLESYQDHHNMTRKEVFNCN
jgi:hypothetical protein